MSDDTESEHPAKDLDPCAFTSGEKLVGVAGVVMLVGGAVYAGWAIRSGQQCMARTPDEICGLAYVSAALLGAPPALIGLLMSLVVVWRRTRRLPAREDDATAPWRQVHRRPPDQEH
jgi:F0F1-type ATP synthase membrane subunit c/vacuolar-type H+-ATPase subunit K